MKKQNVKKQLKRSELCMLLEKCRLLESTAKALGGKPDLEIPSGAIGTQNGNDCYGFPRNC